MAVLVAAVAVASALTGDRASASRADRVSALDWDRAWEPAQDQESAAD